MAECVLRHYSKSFNAAAIVAWSHFKCAAAIRRSPRSHFSYLGEEGSYLGCGGEEKTWSLCAAANYHFACSILILIVLKHMKLWQIIDRSKLFFQIEQQIGD